MDEQALREYIEMSARIFVARNYHMTWNGSAGTYLHTALDTTRVVKRELVETYRGKFLVLDLEYAEGKPWRSRVALSVDGDDYTYLAMGYTLGEPPYPHAPWEVWAD